MRRQAFLFLSAVPMVFFSVVGCSEAETETREFDVAPYRQPCTGEGSRFCLRVANPPGAAWTYFYDPIAGFDPKWGTSYRIRVEVRRVDNPPADGAWAEYRLLEIVSQTSEPPGTDFSITFRTEQAVLLVASASGELQMLEGPKLTCPDAAACQAARAWVTHPAGNLQLSLRYPSPPSTDLVVIASSTN
jgi:hypothetical protein